MPRFIVDGMTPQEVGSAMAAPNLFEGMLVRVKSGEVDMVTVGPGSVPDKTGNNTIVLTDAENVANLTIRHSPSTGLPQLNGIDEIGLDNLVSGAITGSWSPFNDTITTTGSIIPYLKPKTPNPSSSTIVTSGITVTGTGTKFLTDVSVNDLIGNSANGWSRVINIISDISITLSEAIPGGDISGATWTVLEHPTIECGSASSRMESIDPAGTTISVVENSDQPPGSPVALGVEIADSNGGQWLAVWVIDNGVTPGLLVSTQRTELLSPPSGYTSCRRIGWVKNNNAGDLQFQDSWSAGNGVRRVETGTTPILALATSVGGSTAPCWSGAPPTASILLLVVTCDPTTTSATHTIDVGPRNSPQVYRVHTQNSDGLDFSHDIFHVPCDPAQWIYYRTFTTEARASVSVKGWFDVL